MSLLMAASRWPSGLKARSQISGGGFETFYGFIGGENNQWDPALYDGTTFKSSPAEKNLSVPVTIKARVSF